VILSLLALVIGAGVCAALWSATSSMFDVDALRRSNYRGASVLTGVGVLIPVTLALLAGFIRLMQVITERNSSWDQLVGPSVAAALGFGLLGLLDDVTGVGQSGGFRAHARRLLHGEISSAMLKVVGGAAVALVVSAAIRRGDEGVLGALRDAAIVALAANLANLLDRRPGRATKVATAAFVVAAVTSGASSLVGPALGIGAGIGLLPAEFRERVMLGDAGANPLGALCGMAALVAVPGATGRWVLVGSLVALNLASEFVSFSRVIDAVAPLRWLDQLGRRHDLD
jgi:UDP-GlcNAc:undecaprenyl-phosphate GlcNAc-1-phosphate transferase